MIVDRLRRGLECEVNDISVADVVPGRDAMTRRFMIAKHLVRLGRVPQIIVLPLRMPASEFNEWNPLPPLSGRGFHSLNRG
jgi:hypothetical protein